MQAFPASRTAAQALPIAVLGVAFDNLSMSEAVDAIDRMIRSRQAHYVVTANVDFLVQALNDVELRRILLDAHLVLCDGTPLVWASNLLGNRLRERVAGSDLAPLLLQLAEQKRYRVFLLGATPEALDRARLSLRHRYPHLEVCGTCSPPFADLLEMDHARMAKIIREAEPDLLFVSFGCPKQEKWMAMHYRSIGVPVSIGVGAVIDFLGGTVRRAPQWMQRAGLEWLFRLAQEPRRLFHRYWRDFVWFGRMLLRQWHRLREPRRGRAVFARRVGDRDAVGDATGMCLAGWVDAAAVRSHGAEWEQAAAAHDWIVHADGVEFIDSTGIAFLIRLQKKSRLAGRKLVLVAPSEPLNAALKLMQLTDLFLSARNTDDARRLLGESALPPVKLESREQCLIWRGEITASNVDEVWNDTVRYLQGPARCWSGVRIDLSQLQFIDSAGVGLMIRAHKTAGLQGIKLRFVRAQSAVRNVLQIARLESLLEEIA